MANARETKTETHIIASKDGMVKVTQPKGKGKHHRGVAVVLDTDDVLRAQADGFANFLREYAVVGLAIGFIAGQQANTVVKQLVASFIDPPVKILFGQNLSSWVGHFHHHHTTVEVPWGLFVYDLIEFFIVLLVVYLVVKLFRLDKFRKA